MNNTMNVDEVLAVLNGALNTSIKQIDVTLPEVEITNGNGDEEVAVLVISDLQIGHKTPTTTARIIGNRADRLVSRTLKMVNTHRKAYPINRLVVFLLGDLIQSEEIGHKVTLNELEMVLYDQVFEGAIPTLERVLTTLVPFFSDGVDVYTVSGNHGRIDKFHSDTTNFDTFIYKILEGRLAGVKNLRWHIEAETFWQKVKIWRKTFLIVHGDMIRMWMNIPWYGITQRAMRWQGSLPGNDFEYLVLGHFHVISNFNWNDIEVFVNGCFVTDDEWVLKQIGMQSTAKQWLFGVHPRKGVSWRYQIVLD